MMYKAFNILTQNLEQKGDIIQIKKQGSHLQILKHPCLKGKESI